ncbi:hypothetical protein JCM10449v2_007978 [Rhodotorula kratochvilovae]
MLDTLRRAAGTVLAHAVNGQSAFAARVFSACPAPPEVAVCPDAHVWRNRWLGAGGVMVVLGFAIFIDFLLTRGPPPVGEVFEKVETFSLEWTIKDIGAMLARARESGQDEQVESPSVCRGRWRVGFKIGRDSVGWSLRAVPQKSEAGETMNRGRYACDTEVVAGEKTLSSYKCGRECAWNFDAQNKVFWLTYDPNAAGFEAQLPGILNEYKDFDELTFRWTVTRVFDNDEVDDDADKLAVPAEKVAPTGEVVPAEQVAPTKQVASTEPVAEESLDSTLRPLFQKLREFFNNPLLGDTVVEVTDAEGLSSYAYTKLNVIHDDPFLRPSCGTSGKPYHKLDMRIALKAARKSSGGDLDEFSVFRGDRSDEQQQSTLRLDELSDSDDGVLVETPRVSYVTYNSPDYKIFEEIESSEKKYYSVKVPYAASHNTILAYLYYLHFGSLFFGPSPAAALAKPPAQDSPSATDAMSGNEGQPRCSAHALYRIAWVLELNVLEQARAAIVAGLTVETAAYELFSDLSCDHSELRDTLLPFVVANWDAVRATAGWAHAAELISEGKIKGAWGTLQKIVAGVKPKE